MTMPKQKEEFFDSFIQSGFKVIEVSGRSAGGSGYLRRAFEARVGQCPEFKVILMVSKGAAQTQVRNRIIKDIEVFESLYNIQSNIFVCLD